MYRTLLLVVLSVSLCNAQNDYEEVHDTCNTLSSYMKARSQNYSQMYSAVPGEELAVCPGGQSCCSVTTEDYFKTEITTFMGKLHFDRTRNIAKLNAAKKNIGIYMTQLLTLAYSHNNRTQGVVENYLNIANVQRVDKMEIPKAVLLDMAQSNGVNELRSDNTMCLGEMMDLLMPLGQLQIQGLSLARLFYQAIDPAVEVLTRMPGQTLPDECIQHFLQINRCGLCLDSTSVLGCMSNCMAVASPCFSHIKAASGNWDEFARLTNVVINKLDQFGRFYQSSITSIMQLMQIKLADNDVADMCGYDISSNLARNKRSTSSIRTSVLDPTFMETLFSGMDKIHCQRTATENDRCWNGVSVGTNNAVADLGIVNVESISDELAFELETMGTFNQKYAEVEKIEISPIDNNLERYSLITEKPDFVQSHAISQTLSSLVLVPLLAILY